MVIFVFIQHQICSRKYELELKTGKLEEDRQEKTLERSRNVRENFAEQMRRKKKIVGGNMLVWNKLW